MKKLSLMVLRDIKKNKGQYIAVILVVIIGIALYNASYLSYQNLKNSTDYYYDEYRLPHLFIKLSKTPESIAGKIEEIEGVSKVQGRLVFDVPMDLPGYENKVRARVISVPFSNLGALNRLHIEEGSYISGAQQGQVLVEKQFWEYHRLKAGTDLYPVINGKRIKLTAQGKVVSPEYIYPIPSAQQLMPDNERFAILYVEHRLAQQLFGYEGTVNDIIVELESAHRAEGVRKALEDLLRPYGLITVTERKDQISYRMLDNEMKQLESMGLAYPVIFLLIASIVIYMLLLRLVDNQRRQIGVLMAMGFSKREILFHYLKYALFIGFAGSLAGSILGLWLGNVLTRYYLTFFNIPVLKVKIYYGNVLIGIAMSLAFCGIAGFNAARRVLGIAPAEAMRPAAPPGGSKWWGERIFPYLNRIRISWRLTFRNLWRNKVRTLFTVFGITATVGLMISILFMLDAMDFLFADAFGENQVYDYKLTFTKDMGEDVINDLAEFEEVDHAEPIAEYPFKIELGWKEKDAVIVGIEKGSDLYKLRNPEGNRVYPPGSGILLADVLARQIGVKEGDVIHIKSLYKPGVEKDVRVAGLVKQYLGFNGFMDIQYLGNLLQEGKVINGALINVKYGAQGFVKELENMPNTQNVEAPDEMVQEYYKYLDLIYAYIGVIVVLSSIMGFAIIYNTTTINIMERKRELASLRVMGFSKKEVAELIFNENIAVSIMGLLAGMPVGRMMAGAMVHMVPEEIMSLPLVIYPRTYLLAVATVMIFVFLAQLANMRRISRLDLVEVMKSRE